MRIRIWIVVLLAVSVSDQLWADEIPERPNILWITCEDLSPSMIGCHGNAQATTPNIDRLTREGARYTRGICHRTGVFARPLVSDNDVHEPPMLDVNGPELVPGDAITIEPGLYRQDLGASLRVEEIVVVTENGCENLNTLNEGLRWK